MYLNISAKELLELYNAQAKLQALEQGVIGEEARVGSRGSKTREAKARIRRTRQYLNDDCSIYGQYSLSKAIVRGFYSRATHGFNKRQNEPSRC